MADEAERAKWPYWSSAHLEATGAWAERRRLAKAMREVIDRLVTSDAPEAELRAAANALERYAGRLAGAIARRFSIGRSQLAPFENAPEADIRALCDARL